MHEVEETSEIPQACTHDLEFFAYAGSGGKIVIRHGHHLTTIVEFDGLGDRPVYSWFSGDDRLLAARFADGAVGVWDWQRRRLLFRAESLPGHHPVPTLGFTPDASEVWLLGKDRRPRRYSTASGELLSEMKDEIRGEGLELDRSGKRLLIVEGGNAAVWDARTSERLGQWMVTNRIYSVTWHPDGDHFVLAEYQNGLFSGEVGRVDLTLLEGSRGNGVVHTRLAFTPDGQHLLAAGWSGFSGIWDAATYRLVLQSHDACIGQISRDGSAVTVWLERRGYGVRRLLNPVGVSRMRVPSTLGNSVWSAAWHPRGRWLIVGHDRGWSLRDTDQMRLVESRHENGACQSVRFLPFG